MSTNQPDVKTGERSLWSKMTLAEYIRRRNGVPAGSPGSLRNMLNRSFGAGSFAGFWRYWNPIFGYGLGRYVYSPLKRVVPPAPALVLTFVVCGALHDLVTIAIRGSLTFFFTPWFFIFGVGVLFGRAVGMDLSNRPWLVRAGANLTYIGVCLALTILARRVFSIP